MALNIIKPWIDPLSLGNKYVKGLSLPLFLWTDFLPLLPSFSIFQQHSRFFCSLDKQVLLSSGPLSVLFPLPRMVFLKLFIWLVPAHHSVLCLNVTLSYLATLSNVLPESCSYLSPNSYLYDYLNASFSLSFIFSLCPYNVKFMRKQTSILFTVIFPASRLLPGIWHSIHFCQVNKWMVEWMDKIRRI